MRTLLFLFLTYWIPAGFTQSRPLAAFSITPDRDIQVQPLSVDLSGLDYNEDRGKLVVVLKDGRMESKLSSQLTKTGSPRLWFFPGKVLKAGKEYSFEITREAVAVEEELIQTRTDKDHITIYSGGQEVLKYRHSMIEAPEGTNPLYRRKGAYIHPLFSPEGKILTRIQPDDHYHHYGIWNPWTHTVFEGRQVDFWNLALGQGTVRFAGILSTCSGPLCGGFRVHHEHVDFTAPGPDKTALNETWDVRVWTIEINDRPVWVIDYTFLLNCAGDSSIELSQYRYGGGIGFRATAEWTKENSIVLTSEGKTRNDADASFARWCMLEGATGEKGRSGVAVMSHPANRAHPEPMRVWPDDATEGRGDQFFEFCPIRHQEWILNPGKEYVLKYRMVVFDGKLDAATINGLWYDYAHPPGVIIH